MFLRKCGQPCIKLCDFGLLDDRSNADIRSTPKYQNTVWTNTRAALKGGVIKSQNYQAKIRGNTCVGGERGWVESFTSHHRHHGTISVCTHNQQKAGLPGEIWEQTETPGDTERLSPRHQLCFQHHKHKIPKVNNSTSCPLTFSAEGPRGLCTLTKQLLALLHSSATIYAHSDDTMVAHLISKSNETHRREAVNPPHRQ